MHVKLTLSIVFFFKVVDLKTLSTSQSHKHTGLETQYEYLLSTLSNRRRFMAQ